MKLVTPAKGEIFLSKNDNPELFELAKVGLGCLGMLFFFVFLFVCIWVLCVWVLFVWFSQKTMALLRKEKPATKHMEQQKKKHNINKNTT